MSQREVAEVLGVNQATIHNDLKRDENLSKKADSQAANDENSSPPERDEAKELEQAEKQTRRIRPLLARLGAGKYQDCGLAVPLAIRASPCTHAVDRWRSRPPHGRTTNSNVQSLEPRPQAYRQTQGGRSKRTSNAPSVASTDFGLIRE
jgi:hypothetical protein